MKLQTVGPPERGSLSVVYSCPECGYEIAMLTNAYETQVVQSLGVRIGPEGGGRPSAAPNPSATEPGLSSGGGCPFAGMVSDMDGARESAGQATGEAVALRWTSGAEARLANIPAFVRPMARTGIERFARERGAVEVDEKILDAAREFFGM